ncbi:MAG TPA: PilZ domain-containing protein, partial [Candidatus Angelobacter sp.]|nr:PilZ domain-containing protein [Candidatus Angelobacter sp.]
ASANIGNCATISATAIIQHSFNIRSTWEAHLVMAQPQTEKRSTRRFSLELPVTVVDSERSIATAQTRDVSSRGVYIYLDSEIAEGVPLEFVMTLPTEITLSDPIRVRCAGRVLRVEKNGDRQGVAVSIERYDFMSEE